MTRTRASAKAAGTRFESSIAAWLAHRLQAPIERRARTGAKDRGDIAGITHGPHRVVIECKDTARVTLAGWITEAHTEALNDGALIGLVVHKRHGVTDPARQWVAMTVADLANLLDPPHLLTDKENLP